MSLDSASRTMMSNSGPKAMANPELTPNHQTPQELPTKPAFRFLDLPLELRHILYRQLSTNMLRFVIDPKIDVYFEDFGLCAAFRQSSKFVRTESDAFLRTDRLRKEPTLVLSFSDYLFNRASVGFTGILNLLALERQCDMDLLSNISPDMAPPSSLDAITRHMPPDLSKRIIGEYIIDSWTDIHQARIDDFFELMLLRLRHYPVLTIRMLITDEFECYLLATHRDRFRSCGPKPAFGRLDCKIVIVFANENIEKYARYAARELLNMDGVTWELATEDERQMMNEGKK